MNNPKYLELLNFIKAYAMSAWLGHIEFSLFLVNEFKPETIVELGVDFAHSTFALAGEGQGTVYGIDCFEGDVHAGFRDTFSIVKDTYQTLLTSGLLPKDNIVFIKGFFDDVAKDFNKPIDLLHIDGLHTYEAVKNDFETWSPKLTDNGIIIMHDISAFPYTVGKFFSEIEYPKTQVYHSAGLGIVSKNQEVIDKINELWVKKLYVDDNHLLKHSDHPEYTIRL